VTNTMKACNMFLFARSNQKIVSFQTLQGVLLNSKSFIKHIISDIRPITCLSGFR